VDLGAARSEALLTETHPDQLGAPERKTGLGDKGVGGSLLLRKGKPLPPNSDPGGVPGEDGEE